MQTTNEVSTLAIMPYIPCPIMVGTTIRKLIGASWGEAALHVAEFPDEKCESLPDWILNESTCKIILRPLSEIPNNADLCIEIINALDIQDMFTNFMSDRVRFGYNALNTKDILYVDLPARLIDRLRRMGYDFGYDNIPSLIDCNLAIDYSELVLTGAIATEVQ